MTAREAFGNGPAVPESLQGEARRLIEGWARDSLLGETHLEWPEWAAELGRSDLAPLERRYVEQWLRRARVQLVAEGLIEGERAGEPALTSA